MFSIHKYVLFKVSHCMSFIFNKYVHFKATSESFSEQPQHKETAIKLLDAIEKKKTFKL